MTQVAEQTRPADTNLVGDYLQRGGIGTALHTEVDEVTPDGDATYFYRRFASSLITGPETDTTSCRIGHVSPVTYPPHFREGETWNPIAIDSGEFGSGWEVNPPLEGWIRESGLWKPAFPFLRVLADVRFLDWTGTGGSAEVSLDVLDGTTIIFAGGFGTVSNTYQRQATIMTYRDLVLSGTQLDALNVQFNGRITSAEAANTVELRCTWMAAELYTTA